MSPFASWIYKSRPEYAHDHAAEQHLRAARFVIGCLRYFSVQILRNAMNGWDTGIRDCPDGCNVHRLLYIRGSKEAGPETAVQADHLDEIVMVGS